MGRMTYCLQRNVFNSCEKWVCVALWYTNGILLLYYVILSQDWFIVMPLWMSAVSIRRWMQCATRGGETSQSAVAQIHPPRHPVRAGGIIRCTADCTPTRTSIRCVHLLYTYMYADVLTQTYTCRPVDGTSMNEECEAVKTTLWAEAPTAGWPPSLRSDCEIFNVRRRCAPSSHVSNERTRNPMAGKIRDDWWVQPSHGEASGLRQPRFWIRIFLLLGRLPAKANEPCQTYTQLNSVHTRKSAFSWSSTVQLVNLTLCS